MLRAIKKIRERVLRLLNIRMKGWLLAGCAMLGLASIAQAGQPRLLRYPDIHGNQVVFSYAGDLWIAATDGGAARQLTNGPGLELFPKFSPDGKWIAFTGQYGGDEQVFIIPASGGAPRQLTWYPARGPMAPRSGSDNQVTGWKPDGSAVLFRSFQDVPQATDSRLYTVSVDNGTVETLPMARSGSGAFSPDGKKLLFSPLFRDFRTWKRYQGGWAPDLYIADLQNLTLTNITNTPRTERDPMWTDKGIYYLSDQDGHMNLYQAGADGANPRKLTDFTEDGADFASADAAGDVVMQFGAGLRLYEAKTGKVRPLDIDVPATDVDRMPRLVGGTETLEWSALSPDGQHVAIISRGDIFIMQSDQQGAVVNLTHSPGAHDRDAAWSPDGGRIAYFSDASGDEEIWVVPAGGGTPRQVTKNSQTRYYRPVWSPDGAHVAVLDREGTLFSIDMTNGERRQVGSSKSWDLRQYEWSPDGRYLAYAELQPNDMRTLRIWDSRNGQAVTATDPAYDSGEPVWSPDGRYLAFLSVRDVNLQISETEWNFAATRQTRLYLLALQKDTPNPFPNGSPAGTEPDKGKDKAPESPPPVDMDGLADRLIPVPIGKDNYSDLNFGPGNSLLYRISDPASFGREGPSQGTLFALPLGKEKPNKITGDLMGYELDRHRQTILLRQGKADLRVAPISPGGLAGEPKRLELERINLRIDPPQEWAAVFNEAWRLYRDYFYDPGMHGHDWKAIGDHYRAMLPALGNRADLNYILGQMIGDLNVSHAYANGGDQDLPKRPDTGLLGARFTFDKAAGLWRITKVFEGDRADPLYRSPLNALGSKVRMGEFLLAIDGVPLDASTHPYQALAGKAGQVVELALGQSRNVERRLLVRTLRSEAPLLRHEERLAAQRLVEKLSGGRVGYVHISDMTSNGLTEFVKDWYGQLRKDGIIIDIRGNTGGNVSRMILERLLRPAFTRGFVRGVQQPQTYPWGGYTQVFTGEMAMLVSETTMSDGDTMAWTFKQTGRGPLIGKRTWGGVIGIGDLGPLLDGGSVTVPQYALAGPKGEWIVEGEGVTPDIEVDFDQPALRGEPDAQLVTAVQNVLSRIKGHPGDLGGPQPYPVKP
ncbi:peptidase S41 [Niveispirillum sp. SYP-B3756]|nr:peptidase S41 [Niveispirillum sp. SYP-B3756]